MDVREQVPAAAEQRLFGKANSTSMHHLLAPEPTKTAACSDSAAKRRQCSKGSGHLHTSTTPLNV